MSSLLLTLSSHHLDILQRLENKVIDTYALLKTLNEEELSALHKFARVSIVGASTRIENALLTDLEVNWIDTILTDMTNVSIFDTYKETIKNKLSKERERSIEEVTGCRQMLLLIYQDATSLIPLKEVDVRALHHELLAPYQQAAPYRGHYKDHPNYVVQENHQTGDKRIVFKTADAGPITQASMHDLVQWYQKIYETDLRTLPIACEFVYRFLAIHPFQDGNGRLGRGLFLLLLLQSRQEALATVARYLPIDRFIEKHKEEYYFVLNRCSGGTFKQNPKDYHIHYFLEFMIKVLGESLDSLTLYRKRYHSLSLLSKAAEDVLSCFREHPEVRLQTHSIAQETGLPLRTVVYALSALLKHDLIQKYGQGAATRYQLTF